jgi:hypothetical protein
MGLLSDEQYDDMVSRMEATASGEDVPEVEAQADGPPQSDDSTDSKQAEDGSSSDAEDVKEEVETKGGDSEPEVPKVPESVPYGRFREVNEKFRSRERDLQQAQQRIHDLEQLTLQRAPREGSSDEWLDELIATSETPESKELEALKGELEAVKSWQQQRTQQLVTTQLETEISSAVEKHPEVSAEELWQAVAVDGSVDVDSVATHIEKSREQLRSRYTADAQQEVQELKAKLAEAEKVATEARAFRRPGASATAPPPPTGGRAPQSIHEATSAFAEALRERTSL